MTIRNYSSNCCWQDLWMDAKVSPCRLEERWGIYTFSKHLPQIFTNYKGENSNIAMEKQIARKVKIKVNITGSKTSVMHPPPWCSENSNHLCAVLAPNPHPQRNCEKHQTNPHGGTVY